MKKLLTVSGITALVVVLQLAIFTAPHGGVDLRHAVAENMAVSGVTHTVTAVLLNFRGYDTLLEVAVLLAALIAILAVSRKSALLPREEGEDLLVMALARRMAPLMVVVGGYLLWAGAFRPGGAFQAGAVLAAAAVLLHLAGLMPAWRTLNAPLRAGISLGFIVFLAIAIALTARGAFLQYPPSDAGLLIVLIEATLTVSLGLLLAGLFLFLSERG